MLAQTKRQFSRAPVTVNPVGIALACVGALLAVIAIFLPLADTTSFPAGVKGNTIIQADSGGALLFVALAIAVLGATYRYHATGRTNWGVPFLGVIVVAAAIATGNNEDLFALYGVDPLTGTTDFTSSVVADPAIALYVTGAGGVFMFIGGWIMRRGSTAIDIADEVAVEDATLKRCPECAESVQDAARVCRFCGHRFDGAPTIPD